MPQVLVLAHHFPPIGGAGVQRTLGSVRHLPTWDIEPVVVTGPGQTRDRWTPRDSELVDRLAGSVEIHRLDGPEPASRGLAGARIDRLRGAPEPWVRWWVDGAVALGREVGSSADAVLASCIPYETARAGARLATELGLPWIADLEDPWALDEMRLYPTALHRRRELSAMRAALAGAAAVVMAAPEAARRLEDAVPELRGRVQGIPIGFESSDFAGDVERADDGVLRIVHTGSMHTDFGLHLRRSRLRRRALGGSVPGVDFLPRSHFFLVQAIEALFASDPGLRGSVELHLAGELTAGDRAVAADRPFVHPHGLLSHARTVALMRSADLLFLPMHDLPAGERAGLIPYKTYEYLAAERPMLAAVPDGDVRDMLAPLEHVTLVRPTDVEPMTAALRAALSTRPRRVRDGIGSPALRRLERRASVARIAGVLAGVVRERASSARLAA